MNASCLFGIVIFNTNSTVVYRFLSDTLYEHILQGLKKQGSTYDDNPVDSDVNDHEHRNSLDDDLPKYFSVLLRVYEQALDRNDPIKQIKLESNLQIFYDQITENLLICMADISLDSIIVLKTINLFKALIHFHIGALPFTYSNIADQSINRISASLEYYLNNINTNQSLLFESCEHLIINSLVRKPCSDVCLMIVNDLQNIIKIPRKTILITCHDKIVYSYKSEEQSTINNADIFLLLLNQSSRTLRKEFEGQKNRSMTIGHRYQCKQNSQTDSTRTTTENTQSATTDNINDCSTSQNEIEKNYLSEIVFLKTADRVIAPFNLITIPLVNNLSVLILIQWEISLECSDLFFLVRQLDIYASHGLFPFNKLNAQVKAVENSPVIRQYFEKHGIPVTRLSDSLNNAHELHRSSNYIDGDINQKQRIVERILRNFKDINFLTSAAFAYLFFESDEYAPLMNSERRREEQPTDVQMDGIDTDGIRRRRNEYDVSSIAKILRRKTLSKLEDWFQFIEVKSQRNITMNFLNEFAGLVHFVFIDRLHGQIFAPNLIPDPFVLSSLNSSNNYILEKKILAFIKECLSTLHEGFTSYTTSDEHFIYNYTLRLQENNGASMRLYKPFTQTLLPSVLHVDFYRALAKEYYPTLAYQTSVACFELISVHLRLVPASVVRTQCEQLWPKLMEPFE